MLGRPRRSALVPYTTLFRSDLVEDHAMDRLGLRAGGVNQVPGDSLALAVGVRRQVDLTRPLDTLLELLDQLGLVSRHQGDPKSTRQNSSHCYISYAVFCTTK